MSDVRRMLSDDERSEYDALFYAATHYKDGKRRKSAEIGREMLRLLRDAEQAERPWANWVMEDALVDGLRSKAIRWCNAKEIVETIIGGRVVKKAAAYGIRKRDAETGRTEWTRPIWPDMGRDELIQVISASVVRSAAEAELAATARRLLKLVDETGAETVADALELKEVTLEEFLREDEGAA